MLLWQNHRGDTNKIEPSPYLSGTAEKAKQNKNFAVMQCQAITLIRKKFVTNNNCFPSPLDLNIPTTLCIFFSFVNKLCGYQQICSKE